MGKMSWGVRAVMHRGRNDRNLQAALGRRAIVFGEKEMKERIMSEIPEVVDRVA